MAEVYVLPGVERRDLAGEPIPAQEVLQAAIDNGLIDVVIVGRDRAGEFYLATSGSDTDRAVGQLMRAVTFLSDRTVEPSVIETEPPTVG